MSEEDNVLPMDLFRLVFPLKDLLEDPVFREEFSEKELMQIFKECQKSEDIKGTIERMLEDQSWRD